MIRRIVARAGLPFVAVLVGWAGAAPACVACSCADTSEQEVFAGMDAVFRGTVLVVVRPRWRETLLWELGVADDVPGPRAILRVQDAWKGVPGREVAVEIDGYGFDPAAGDAYVVFAYQDADGGLASNGCLPTVGEYEPARFQGIEVSLGPGTPVADAVD